MPESSREEIAKLEALYANNPEGRVFTHLAEALRKAGDLERARTILEDGIAKHPTYASAHVVHGRVLAGLERSEDAAEAFRRVLSLDPHNLIALRSLGDLARSAGRAEEAIGYFEQLKHHDPTNEEIDQIITELSARPAPAAAAEAPAASPAAETVAEQEWAAPERADAPAFAEASAAAEVSKDIDLDWVPDLGNAFDALPGDLGSLASTPAATGASTPEPAIEEPPVFDLPDGVGDMALDAALEQASESPMEEVDFESTSFQSDFELPTFDEPAAEAAPEPEPLSFEPDVAFEPDAGFEPDVAFEPEVAFEPDVAFEPEPSFAAAFEMPAAEPEPEPQAEPAAEPDAEAGGEVVTETIAELYSSQGLHDRAAEVYRALLRQRPGDGGLEAKLREAESAAGGGWEAAFSEPAFEPTAPEALQPVQTDVAESEPDAEGWIAGGAGTAASAPTPYAWSETAEPEDSGAPVRDYFRNLLSWRPAHGGTSQPVGDVFSASVTPAADEEDPLLLLEELAPDEPEPAPPPLTAATVVAPEPLPWEEPAAELAPPPPPPPPPPAPPAANAGAEAKTSDEAFDAWFGAPEPEQPQAAAPASAESASQPEGEAGGEDDDDLEMFRSWLQSLKK